MVEQRQRQQVSLQCILQQPLVLLFSLLLNHLMTSLESPSSDKEVSTARKTAQKQENLPGITQSKATKSSQTLPSVHQDTSEKLISKEENSRNEVRKQMGKEGEVPDIASRVAERPKTILVTGRMRSLLYDWMLLVASDHGFSKDCSALAMGLMDRYLQKKPQVIKSELQSLGFIAVGLAGKLEDNKQMANIQGLFGRIDVQRFEIEIMKVLNFNLQCETYIFWAKLLMKCWDNFVSKDQHEYKSIKFLERSQRSYERVQDLFDILDCMNLEEKSVQMKTDDLVKNVFYILVRMYAQMTEKTKNQKNFLSEFYKNDAFSTFFGQFIVDRKLGGFKADKRIGKYLHNFFFLPRKHPQADLNCESWTELISMQIHKKYIYEHIR